MDLTAALSGTSVSLIFSARAAAVSTKKEILPLSLSPEIWKQHCASKAMTVIPPLVCSAPHLLYPPPRNSRGRLLPREDSCRVGGFHYTCSSGNNYHIVLNFIALGCSLHTRANASASCFLGFLWFCPQQPAHFFCSFCQRDSHNDCKSKNFLLNMNFSWSLFTVLSLFLSHLEVFVLGCASHYIMAHVFIFESVFVWVTLGLRDSWKQISLRLHLAWLTFECGALKKL